MGNPNEEWRTIPEHEGYQVSSLGRVMGPRGLRKMRQQRGGYLSFNVWDGKYMTLFPHRLAAAAFLGPKPDGFQVNHKNGDKSDNRVENLEYVTPSQNVRHAHRLGLIDFRRGEQHQNSTTTEEVVREVRRLYATTRLPVSEIARRTGLRYNHAWQIARNKLWKHLHEGPQEE